MLWPDCSLLPAIPVEGSFTSTKWLAVFLSHNMHLQQTRSKGDVNMRPQLSFYCLFYVRAHTRPGAHKNGAASLEGPRSAALNLSHRCSRLFFAWQFSLLSAAAVFILDVRSICRPLWFPSKRRPLKGFDFLRCAEARARLPRSSSRARRPLHLRRISVVLLHLQKVLLAWERLCNGSSLKVPHQVLFQILFNSVPSWGRRCYPENSIDL